MPAKLNIHIKMYFVSKINKKVAEGKDYLPSFFK